ncbi:primase-helicase family protein [Dysgonomonas sp. Marseille-P4677]|uniref:primase-helicase family protein n=1 Tax=Dysgonomonas sp. Marseille-P4677 TaxID=2364790 RepID=UPI001F16C3E0|nr:primase-helicase family protein [Dysgonomonas sp. Marseille-P4677]
MEILIPWNKETIQSDHGKDYIAKIPCYDGLCSIPSHIDYKSTIETFYNQYHELDYKPKAGNCTTILTFLKHIFGEQYEFGLDYLKILYENPLQALPILCLVSSERGAGKTTFLNLLKLMFGKNMTLNTNDDFRSQFNYDWANKLVIAVDEVLLDKREDSERIKNLSTARQFKAEAKGKDRQEVEFFGKFILCSNNETNFICIDNEETRYWVRKVLPFQNQLNCTSLIFFERLKAEIPAFLDFLINRPFHTENKSRMWFMPKQLETEALIKLKSNNKSLIEKEMINVLEMIFEDRDLDIIQFQLQDIIASMNNLNYRNLSISKVKEILVSKWGLSTVNSSYTKYIVFLDGTISTSPHKGRYYELSKDRFLKINY